MQERDLNLGSQALNDTCIKPIQIQSEIIILLDKSH